MERSEFKKLLKDIYADNIVTPAEIETLQMAVDIQEEALLGKLGRLGKHGTLGALAASFQVVVQLLQQTLLEVRKGKLKGKEKKQVADFVRANLDLFSANLKAFSRH